MFKVNELCRPHLVLTHTGAVDSLRTYGFTQLFQHKLGIELPIRSGIIATGEPFLEPIEVIPPWAYFRRFHRGVLTVLL